MPPKKRLRSLQEPQSEESEQDSSGSDQSDAEQVCACLKSLRSSY